MACVAACPNSSAMLFVSAKVSHLALLPQGQPERTRRAIKMVKTMDAEGFVHLSDRPGLGADLNWDFIAANTVSTH